MAQANGTPVGRRLRSGLLITLVAIIFVVIFFFSHFFLFTFFLSIDGPILGFGPMGAAKVPLESLSMYFVHRMGKYSQNMLFSPAVHLAPHLRLI